MPNWRSLLDEAQTAGSTYDILRRKYLAQLHALTGRNVILYYSGWLQKTSFTQQNPIELSLNDSDKNGFMSAIHELDRSKGLDLFLHTPGGEIAATESLVDYLRSMFGTNIRAIIPQLALSAGTMIALSCKTVVMGRHSSLGPIDPQLAGVPAHGIIEEFRRAAREIQQNQATIPLWQMIFNKYHPTLIGECEKAIDWSNAMVKEWLISGMFEGQPDADVKATRIVTELGDHALTRSHSRHISMNRARELGIEVVALEDDDDLQEAVLTVHHACVQTLSSTPAYKIIENQNGVAFIQAAGMAMMIQQQ